MFKITLSNNGKIKSRFSDASIFVAEQIWRSRVRDADRLNDRDEYDCAVIMSYRGRQFLRHSKKKPFTGDAYAAFYDALTG
jgi:hypothetical protein